MNFLNKKQNGIAGRKRELERHPAPVHTDCEAVKLMHRSWRVCPLSKRLMLRRDLGAGNEIEAGAGLAFSQPSLCCHLSGLGSSPSRLQLLGPSCQTGIISWFVEEVILPRQVTLCLWGFVAPLSVLILKRIIEFSC